MDGRCIVVGAGELNLSRLKKKAGDLVIAADGGYLYCGLLGLEPDLVIGDFDSVGEEQAADIGRLEEEKQGKVVRLNPQKDDTDMLAAVKLGLQRGYRKFLVYAAMGGRLEHTIANIQTLLYLKEQGAEGYLLDADSAVFVIRDEEVAFEPQTEGMLSLFAVNGPAEGVNLRGMKYPLYDARVTEDFPIGISNEFTGAEGRVSVAHGSLLAIVRRAQ